MLPQEKTRNYIEPRRFLQPCRCLWRGSEQITRTTRLRRMILHLRQIFFTDAWTLMSFSYGGCRPGGRATDACYGRAAPYFARNTMRALDRS